jgi:hypothetical protein
MSNGCQKSNGFEKTKEGGKIFNTFFYPNVQSKHVRPLATNVLRLAEVPHSRNFGFEQELSCGILANRCYAYVPTYLR